MTGRAERREGQRAQERRLAARGAPVEGPSHVQAQAHEDPEEEQQPLAHEPHVTEPRLERHARERSRLERRHHARLEDRGLVSEDGDAGAERQPDQRARERDDARLPGQGRRPIRAAGEENERRAADDQDGRAQVDEPREKAELSHSQSKLSVIGLAKRPAAAPTVLTAAAPRVSVIFVASSGSMTSAA